MNWLKHTSIAVLGLALATGAWADETNVEAPPKESRGIKVVIDTDKPAVSKEAMDKLTPDQIFELEKIKARQPDDIPSLAPIIVFIVFACPVAIVGTILFYRHRRNLVLHKTLAAMIDKGVPIPPELLQPEKLGPGKRPKSDLQRALVLMGIGLGLIIFLLAMHNSVWGVGFIPLLMGVGYLLAWKLEKKDGNG
jgi:hypothetical protein